MKKTLLAFLTVIMLGLLVFTAGCSNNNDTATDLEEETTTVESSELDKSNPIYVMMEVNGGQQVEFALYPGIAPQTVANFVKLVNEGFYNGLTFHRVIPGFVAQAGDPTATGTGGSDETIVGEFESNGYTNNLSHTRGVISMARTSEPNSASSQFFISAPLI